MDCDFHQFKVSAMTSLELLYWMKYPTFGKGMIVFQNFGELYAYGNLQKKNLRNSI